MKTKIIELLKKGNIEQVYDLLDMGVRVDWQIQELIDRGLTDEKWRSLVNPASMDITISNEVMILIDPKDIDIPFRDQKISTWNQPSRLNCKRIEEDNAGNHFLVVCLDDDHPVRFRQGDRLLAMTEQCFKFPDNISGEVRLKSSRGREFYEHLEAGWIDPGFEGNLTLELINLSYTDLPLYQGMKIGQIVFHRHRSCRKSYEGKYKGDRSVSISKDTF